jgi:hypothetical protein
MRKIGADEEGLPDEKGRRGGANLTNRLPMRSDQYQGQGSCFFICEEGLQWKFLNFFV